MQFELHLVLPEGEGKAVEKELEFWKHRLREQVLTSVRLTDTKEFSEPELLRLRRVVRLRINRVLPTMRIDGVYMTRYVFELR